MAEGTRSAAGDARFAAVRDALLGTGDFVASQMFGAPGMKLESTGKFFLVQWDEELGFKLDADTHARAMALDGARPLAPDPRRPMKSWVLVPIEHAELDEEFARAAAAFTAG